MTLEQAYQKFAGAFQGLDDSQKREALKKAGFDIVDTPDGTEVIYSGGGSSTERPPTNAARMDQWLRDEKRRQRNN